MSRFRLPLLLLAGALTVLPAARAQDEHLIAGDASRLVTRFYNITPLVVPRQQFPFDLGSGRPAAMAYPGGGFGGGQGGGGGGGFFCLPAEPAQFGGGGGELVGGVGGGSGSGGGDGGGMAGYYGDGSSASSWEPSLKEQLENFGGVSITSLFESNVSPDSWATNGGEGTITELGNSLLVRQSEKVHREFEAFLKQLTTAVIGTGTYHLEVWWLPIADADRTQLNLLLEEGPEVTTTAEALTTLSESMGGYHGTLLCRERVTTHTASGTQVPVVAGSIPVVGGGGAAGEQPIVMTLHLGLVLEAKLSPVPDYLAAERDAVNTERLELSFRSAITNRSDKGQEWPADGHIDRYSMGNHVAEGACQIGLGQPTVIASLTELSSATENAAGHTPELLMIVRVTRPEN